MLLWRRMGALNDRCDSVAKTLGAIFVDPKSWIENLDFGKDRLHLSQSGAIRLSHLYSRVFSFHGERSYSN
jgi:hypothetical protein